jgi:cell division protein FtsW
MIKKRRFNLFRKTSSEHEADQGLLYTIGGLIVFGLVVLSSASAVTSYAKFGSSYHYFNRQILFLVIGLILFYFFSKIDYRFWKRHAFAFLGFSCFLLALVFIPGLAAGHGSAQSWITVFGFSIQPSEFVKVSFLIYLAAWLESRKRELHDVRQGIGPFLIVLFVIASLMIMQPDIGTLFIIAATSLIIYFIGGGKISHIVIIMLLASISIFVMAYLMPYQMNRFKCVLEKDFGAQEECYQLNQSLIAVGSGGFWGRGIGQSRQKFLYLPEVSSDSIFAVIAEEVGFVFSSIFFILYLVLFYRGILIAKYAPDDFGRLLATGIVSWLIIQTFLNIGGVVGMIPMTGVPLPFVSQGGSSLISALIAFGILVNISKQTKFVISS